MKKILIVIILSLGAALSFAAGGFLVFAESCGEVRGEVLRLHILANSDGAADQEVKLLLRDYVLEELSAELSDCETLAAAEERTAELLSETERKCNEFLENHGFYYGASAELVTMDFTTREYEALILPAGTYRALRITLGSGCGQNWWCVIFPQLCLPAAGSFDINGDDVLAGFRNNGGITVKFALYEWFEGLFS